MATPTLFWNLTFFLGGLIIGSLAVWIFWQIRTQSRVTALQVELTQLQTARSVEEEKAQWLDIAQSQLQITFEALAGRTLQTNADEFLKRASERFDTLVNQVRSDWTTQKAEFTGVVSPLRENLTTLDKYVRELEQKREGAYHGLQEQLRQLTELQSSLQNTTITLAQALKAPNVCY